LAYIQSARDLGLSEEVIRVNAHAAGWDAKAIDEAVSSATSSKVEPLGKPSLPTDYRIGAGDVVLVSVWREPDASQEVTVRSDGKVSLPLVKEVELAGLTPGEAERMLSSRFGEMIPGADVTLIIRAVNSRKVYLVGAVRTVGAISMPSRLTVIQALAQAGGLTDFAKKKQIYILRNDDGKQMRLAFNYEAVVKGERMEQNIVLQPDDTIVVPQ
jgi:polysaccharide export outer membrane protein